MHMSHQCISHNRHLESERLRRQSSRENIKDEKESGSESGG